MPATPASPCPLGLGVLPYNSPFVSQLFVEARRGLPLLWALRNSSEQNRQGAPAWRGCLPKGGQTCADGKTKPACVGWPFSGRWSGVAR